MQVSTAAATTSSLLGDYFALTKPTILLLVVITGLPALLLAGHGSVPAGLGIAAIVGTALASAGAGAINHYMDRDIDGLMARTRGRPLPTGHIQPQQALVFGLILSLLAAIVLWFWTTPLATAIAVISIVYYTAFYTGWLKRLTPHNIVIGGAAGASAPLIAWAAVTGQVGLPAWIMFAIIFLWTPPHFWALAIFRKDDYAAAGVPMLPVVAGEVETRRQIWLYAAVLVPATLSLVWIHEAGIVYGVSAIALGGVFLHRSWRVLRVGAVRDCMGLFGFSIVYLLLLFAMLTVDVAVRPLLG